MSTENVSFCLAKKVNYWLAEVEELGTDDCVQLLLLVIQVVLTLKSVNYLLALLKVPLTLR